MKRTEAAGPPSAETTAEAPGGIGKNLLLAGLNALSDGIVLIGADSRIAFWNDAMRQMSAVAPADAIGATLEQIFPEQAGGRLVTTVSWALRNGLPSVLSSSLNRQPLPLTLEGKRIEQSIYVTPLPDEAGGRGCLVCIRDVTALVEKDRLLRTRAQQLQESLADAAQARDAADAANRAKSAFLANMSHELRTPLHAILGFTDVLRRDPAFGARQQEPLAIIHKSGDHLLGLINDVLEIAKIEAGKLKLEPAPFDLGNLIDDVVAMLRIRAGTKGLRLDVDAASQYPRYIVGDAAKIREILINLLSNAIKATDRGGIVLRLTGAAAHGGRLVIEVEDTGCGIAPEDCERILEPFVQIGQPGRQQGTGLGLAIVRQFVELMGGKLSLVSVQGSGSTFRVEMAVVPCTADDIPPTAQPPGGEVLRLEAGQAPYRVLVAEDQSDNRQLLVSLLESVGFEVRHVASGSEAVEQFRLWQPDFVWMDRRMPSMDGIEATRRIRELGGGDTVKIAAVTASIFKEDDEQLAAAGFDDIVHKPFRPERILDSMERLLGVRYRRATAEAGPSPQAELSVAAMGALPAGLRQELAAALALLDNERIASAVDAIEQVAPDLGAALRDKVRRYDYPPIMALLQATAATTA